VPEIEDDLYALPLEEFIAARGQAAKDLRKAGDKEAAARVAKLPKPTPPAWVANQVARERPDLIGALLDAGAALRAAQDAAMAGGGAGALREATLNERHAIDEVMRVAVKLKPGGKALSRPMADRLRTTLHAAAGDPALRAALSAGRLTGEAQAGGAWPFAIGAEDAPAVELPKPKAKKKPKEDPDERAERERAEREAAEARKALEAQLREARSTLKIRERVAKGAEEDVEEADRVLDDARARLEQAQAALADAEAAMETATHVADAARKSRDEARDIVSRLEERLD
jgi:hypothetical protein